MKISKMNLNGRPNQNPIGTTRANRNIIKDRLAGSITNEEGNLLVDTYGSKKYLLGVIVLDNNDFVVFTKKDDISSEIGYVDSNLVYKLVFDNPNLGFKYNYPIHGEFQKNGFGEIIITFTDKVNRTRYVNINKPIDIDNINVFSDYTYPNIESSISSGGELLSGAYYPILSYEKEDEVVTSWIKNYNPVFINRGKLTISQGAVYDTREGNMSGIPSDKQITLQISNIDTRYKKVRLGLIYVANSVRSYYFVKKVNITGTTLNTTLSSLKGLTPIIADEVLVDRSNYKVVENITQLNNTLYFQGLTSYKETNQQSIVNNIKFKFKSTLVDFMGGLSPSTTIQSFFDNNLNNRVRHFQHGEVYAIYIRFKYKWGFGQWFHIPGRLPESSDFDLASDNFRKFHISDTTKIDGTLGYWENENELYPTVGDYPTGKVRHHKFPSIRWMKQNIYNGEPMYGGRKLDILNLELQTSSFNINSIRDCDGTIAEDYQIGYAKRSDTNGLISGQTIFVGSTRKTSGNSVNASLKSFGLNLNFNQNNNNHTVDLYNIRTYDLKNLYNKEAPNINYIRSEVLLRSTVRIEDAGQAPPTDSTVNANLNTGQAIFMADNNVTVPPKEYIKVNSSSFIINDTTKDNVNNLLLEDTILLNLQEPLDIVVHTLSNSFPSIYIAELQTHLITLLNIKMNCYNSMFNQQIVICDERKEQGLFGGDSYISYNNVNTYGNLPWLDGKYTSDITKFNEYNVAVNGVRIANLFLAESRYNFSLRYTNPAHQLGTKYLPVSENYLPNLRRDQEPNLISQAYSEDFHSQNDIEFSNIFNPEDKSVTVNKFVVTRGDPLNIENNLNNWLNFKVNDFYNLVTTRGEVVFFGAGKDYLIIHHKNALFRTRVRTYINTSGEEAFTGKGDIFEQEPEEIIYDKVGALGTQHRWSCYMSKHGYFWIDSEAKKVYRYDGQVTDLAVNGMENFFEDNLNCLNDNPFNSYGLHIVIDDLNKRLLLTKKNEKLKPEYEKSFKGVWKNDQNFINSLQSGDIVIKDGKPVIVK